MPTDRSAKSNGTPARARPTEQPPQSQPDPKNKNEHQQSKTDPKVIYAVARDNCCEIWIDEQSTVWADIVIRDRQESVRLESTQFRRWLRALLRERGYPRPSRADISSTIDELDSWGAMQGAQYTRYLRVAHDGGRVYLDLADDRRQAVEIDGSGWRLVNTVPVRFGRGRSTLALPLPERGGTVDLLRPLTNAADDRHWMLMVGFMVGCFARGPFPLLCLQGEQATGKSTTMTILRNSVDPDEVTRATRPRSVRDTMVAGQKRWILSYDNLSGLSPELSDAFCILATGGASAERKLYTNSEEVVHKRMAPTMCSGIDDIATRGDLVRRSIILELPRIKTAISERALTQRFREVHAKVLGALCDAVSEALCRLGEVESEGTGVSMVDHVAWVEAAAPALGWARGSYENAYSSIQRESYEREVDRDPVTRAIYRYVMAEGDLVGTTSDIMDLLDDRFVAKSVRASCEWPKGTRKFSAYIKRAAPTLRAVGVDVGKGSGRGRRTWHIRRM